MSPGFRRDSINYIMADWNFSKMIGMAVFLASKFKEAAKVYDKQRTEFMNLDACVPNESRAAWMSMSLEATEGPKGVWTSVFSTPSSNGKLQKLARSQQEAESESARTPAKKPGVTQWLITGIELECEQKELRDERGRINEHSGLRQREHFDAKRKALGERIVSFREKRDKYMGECEQPDHPDVNTGSRVDPEDAELGLPSSYHIDTMSAAGLLHL
ncbi:hypothetical protein FRC08_006752, partial [Ceratobasidium sp. 394]